MPVQSIKLIILLSFPIAFISTRLILKYGENFGLYDRSEERRRKDEYKPRFGGIAIYLAIFVSLGIAFLFSSHLFGLVLGNLKEKVGLLLCTTFIFALGVYDDLKGADVKKKLSIQIVASIALYFFGYRIGVITNPFGFFFGPTSFFLPDFTSFLLTLFWLVGITNAFNLIDGMDGLASGVAIICSLAMMVISFYLGHPLIAIFFLAIAGATSGFLTFNMPTARIIMGDSGSLTVGFLFAAISLKGALKGSLGIAFIIPILVLSPAILDTAWATVRRWIQGKSFYTADSDHIHHRIGRSLGGQWRPLFTLYGIYIVFCTLGVTLAFSVAKEIGLFVFFVSLLLITILFYKIGYLHDAGEWLTLRIYGERMIRAKHIHELWDLLMRIVERVKFCGAKLELAESVKSILDIENNGFIWKKQDNWQEVRTIQIAIQLEGNSGNLGRLVLEKNPGFSKLSPNPSPTIEMLQKYVSLGLEKLIHT